MSIPENPTLLSVVIAELDNIREKAAAVSGGGDFHVKPSAVGELAERLAALGAVGVADIAAEQHEAALAALVGAVACTQWADDAGRETTAAVAVLLSPQRGRGPQAMRPAGHFDAGPARSAL